MAGVKAEAARRRNELRLLEQKQHRELVQSEICRRMMLGQSLMSICAEDLNMPSTATILLWRRSDPDFDMALQQAARDRADVLFEEALTIADDARNDWMAKNDPNNPGWIANGEHIQRSRLRVDTRKWAAGKLNPYKYADKLAVEGNPDKPVVVSVTHRIVRAVQHETLPPLADSQEKAIDGWADEN